MYFIKQKRVEFSHRDKEGGRMEKTYKGKELKFDTNGRSRTVKFATKERLAKVNPKNLALYEQYIRSCTIKNKDVKDTTYRTYRSYFNIFLCYIMEYWDNFDLLDEEFLEEQMVDVMEGFIGFLQEDLGNKKKAVNTKLSAVSSFYIWATKRRKIKAHPFDGKLDRMQQAGDEKVISEYYLNREEIEQIEAELALCELSGSEYDWIDRMLWHILFDSACRIGAAEKLSISSLDLEQNAFLKIREKRGKIVSIPFTPSTGELIKKYIEFRNELGVDCDDFFFAKYNGQWQGMSKQSIHARIKKIGYIVGIGDFRPHCIRKSRLNEVAEKDINLAKTLANHESLDTTSRFYTKKKDQTETLNEIMKLQQVKIE